MNKCNKIHVFLNCTLFNLIETVANFAFTNHLNKHQKSRHHYAYKMNDSKWNNCKNEMLTIIIIILFLTLTAVILRLIIKIWIIRNVNFDDYIIICATFDIIINTDFVIVEIHYDFEKHKNVLTQWQFIEFMKYFYGEWIQTFQTLMFNKILICFFLFRISMKRYFIRPI